jgi:hypothetical protein
MVGQDRESHQRDLYEAIERGDFPRWTLYVQIMPEAEASPYTVQPVRPDQGLAAQGLPADRGRRDGAEPQPGELLRRGRAGRVQPRPTMVPGIGFSPDKMLQGRLFSYGDAQRYRLGVNYATRSRSTRRVPGPQLSPRRRHALDGTNDYLGMGQHPGKVIAPCMRRPTAGRRRRRHAQHLRHPRSTTWSSSSASWPTCTARKRRWSSPRAMSPTRRLSTLAKLLPGCV